MTTSPIRDKSGTADFGGFVAYMYFWFAGISLYMSAGVMLAALSINAWRRRDSSSPIEKILFPWHARDACVGEAASGTICGEACRGGDLALASYAAAMSVIWPLKLLFSGGVAIYLRFLHKEH